MTEQTYSEDHVWSLDELLDHVSKAGQEWLRTRKIRVRGPLPTREFFTLLQASEKLEVVTDTTIIASAT